MGKAVGFEVVFYVTADGTQPVRDFLQSLDKNMRAKIYHDIKLLAENGSLLREPYSKHLNEGIFELRSQFGGDISRILYFFVVGRKIVLTNGFIKKTPKTPPTEIERAKRYRRDYLQRKEHGND